MNEFKSPLIGKPGTSSSALLAPVRTEVAGGFKQTILNCLKNWCCCCCPCVKSERYDEATDAVTVDPLMVTPPPRRPLIEITGFELVRPDGRFIKTNPEIFYISDTKVDIKVYGKPICRGRDLNFEEIFVREDECDAMVTGDFRDQLGTDLGHHPHDEAVKLRKNLDVIGPMLDLKKAHSAGSAIWDINISFIDPGDKAVFKIQRVVQQYDLTDQVLTISKGGTKLCVYDLANKRQLFPN